MYACCESIHVSEQAYHGCAISSLPHTASKGFYDRRSFKRKPNQDLLERTPARNADYVEF